MSRYLEIYLKQAVDLATENVRLNRGGPYGALIVKEGAVIATGVNSVTGDNDPTAHAEVMAMRAACKTLDSFQLTGCELYTSCEPCPMCLGAIYWARPDRFYYAATRRKAADAGFDDSFIYDEIGLAPAERSIPGIHLDYVDGGEPFAAWLGSFAKRTY